MASPEQLFTLSWRGAQVLQATVGAVAKGMDDTMVSGVRSAKSNHPRWQNRTGNAEASIRFQPTKDRGGRLVGYWGSFGGTPELPDRKAPYFLFLEVGHHSWQGDRTLRRAADREYPNLIEHVKRHMPK